jgi:hypothetical protein
MISGPREGTMKPDHEIYPELELLSKTEVPGMGLYVAVVRNNEWKRGDGHLYHVATIDMIRNCEVDIRGTNDATKISRMVSREIKFQIKEREGR